MLRTPRRAVLATALATALTAAAAAPALAATDNPTSNSTAQASGLYDGQLYTRAADGSLLFFDLYNDRGTWLVQAQQDATSPEGRHAVLRLASTAVDGACVHVGSNGKTLVLDAVTLPVTQTFDDGTSTAGTSTFAASFRLNGNEPTSNASVTFNPPAGYASGDHYTDTVRPAVATETMFGSTYSQGGQSSDDPLAATLASYLLKGTAS